MPALDEDLGAVSAIELAALAKVNRTTALRWKSGESRVPHAVMTLVRIFILGDAEALLGPDWHRWRFGRDGLLYAPGWRRGAAPGEILAIPYLYGRIAAQQRQRLDALRARRIDRHHTRRARARAAS